MASKTTFFIIWLVFCTLITVPSFLAYADDDHRENRWYNKISDRDDEDDKGKHRKRKRESIGSLSNCLACHITAEEGIYEDDNVKIPK